MNKQDICVIFLWNADYCRMIHDLKVFGTCRFSQIKTMFIWTVSDSATDRQTGKANKTGGKGRQSLNRLFTHRQTNKKLEDWRQRSLAGGQMYLCGIIHLAAAGWAGSESQRANEEGHISMWSGRNKADDYDAIMRKMMMMMLSPWLPCFKVTLYFVDDTIKWFLNQQCQERMANETTTNLLATLEIYQQPQWWSK